MMDRPSVLYVDDERSNLTGFKYMFADDYDVFVAESGAEALELLSRESISIVITDQRMPEMTGVEFLEKVVDHYPDTTRIMLTGYSDITAVVDAINRGHVFHYFRKPWNYYEVRLVISNALDALRLNTEMAKREAWYRTSYDSLALGVGHVSLEGEIIGANQRLAGLLGYTTAELGGKPLADIVVDDDAEALRAQLQKLVSGEVEHVESETRFVHKDGQIVIVLVSAAVAHGSPSHLILSMQDLGRLHATERQTEAVLDSAPDAMLVVSAEGAIERMNDETERLLGFGRAELIGQPIEVLLPQRYRASHVALREGYQRDPVVRDLGRGRVLSAQTRDGTELPVEIKLSPVTLPNGTRQTIASLRDLRDRIAAQQEIREVSERLTLATRAGHIGVWDWDIANDTLIWDDLMHEIFGVSKDAFGATFEAWEAGVHEADRPRLTEEIRTALQGGGDFDTQFSIRCPDGAVRVLRGLGLVLHDDYGVPLRMIGVSWDITSRIEAERAVVTLNEELEERVQLRTAQLQAAKDEADRANLAKSAFLANMSHEIRTPMNVMLGHTQLLLRETSLSEEQLAQLASIERAGSHLLELINDVLEMSKIEAGRTTLSQEPFDLLRLVGDIELMFRPRAEAKGIELSCVIAADTPRDLLGDVGKVRQTAINLVSNAVKFTDRGYVRMHVESGDDQVVTVTVEDTGPGIEDDAQQRIFEPFEQAGEGAAKGGTGLGMAISRHFAQLMGGDITLSSTPGEGSCFTFTFRAEPMESPAGSTDDGRVIRVSEEGAGKTVLVVDDHRANREVLSRLLGSVGLDVQEAPSGEDAVAEVSRNPPDVVLMDLKMPGIGGLEATKRIRTEGTIARVPILVLSAHAMDKDRDEALRAGADGFLSKPFSEGELFRELSRVCGLRFHREPPRGPSTTPAPLLVEALRKVSRSTLVALRQATEAGDRRRLFEIIDSIEGPSQTIEPLQDLARGFEYERLLTLIQSASGGDNG